LGASQLVARTQPSMLLWQRRQSHTGSTARRSPVAVLLDVRPSIDPELIIRMLLIAHHDEACDSFDVIPWSLFYII